MKVTIKKTGINGEGIGYIDRMPVFVPQALIGEEVEIRTYRPIDRQKEFVGELKAYDKESVTIVYEDDTEQTFQRQEIALIRLALDF